MHNADDKWLLDTLCHYAEHAEAEAFEMFCAFLQNKLVIDDQKLAFLQKGRNGIIAFMISVQNKHKATIEFIIDICSQALVQL